MKYITLLTCILFIGATQTATQAPQRPIITYFPGMEEFVQITQEQLNAPEDPLRPELFWVVTIKALRQNIFCIVTNQPPNENRLCGTLEPRDLIRYSGGGKMYVEPHSIKILPCNAEDERLFLETEAQLHKKLYS
jgi:hypothetical protein